MHYTIRQLLGDRELELIPKHAFAKVKSVVVALGAIKIGDGFLVVVLRHILSYLLTVPAIRLGLKDEISLTVVEGKMNLVIKRVALLTLVQGVASGVVRVDLLLIYKSLDLFLIMAC